MGMAVVTEEGSPPPGGWKKTQTVSGPLSCQPDSNHDSLFNHDRHFTTSRTATMVSRGNVRCCHTSFFSGSRVLLCVLRTLRGLYCALLRFCHIPGSGLLMVLYSRIELLTFIPFWPVSDSPSLPML